jgi:Mlc titration factor MtfA (ptsG expression regulator)
MASKKFKPNQIPEVTQEMKICISASAIQLTFGLEKFIFHHFKTIMVYPKAFLSVYGNNYHKGDVNVQGAISLSYEDFLDGYRDPSDAYNLGLHEMAHALELELNLKDEYDTFFAAYYERWIKSAATELVRMNYGQSEFLRKYASRNVKEFFSVCVENFFERPVNMKERLPEIYKHLCLMLNQDPVSAYASGDVRNQILCIAEVPSEPHLFSTDNSWSYTIRPVIFLALCLGLIAVLTKDITVSVIFFTGILLITMWTLAKSNNLILYKQVLQIKPLFTQIFQHKTYRLDQIVSVSLSPARKSVVKISHITSGKIELDTHMVYFTTAQTAEFISRLKALKIMVKCR